MSQVENGNLKKLISIKDIDFHRYVMKNPSNGDIKIKHLTSSQACDSENFRDSESGEIYNVEVVCSIEDWLGLMG